MKLFSISALLLALACVSTNAQAAKANVQLTSAESNTSVVSYHKVAAQRPAYSQADKSENLGSPYYHTSATDNDT